MTSTTAHRPAPTQAWGEEGGRHRREGRGSAREGQRALPVQMLGEAGAFDVLHDQEVHVLMDPAVVEGHDVRVVDLGRGDGLACKAPDQLARCEVVVTQELDGDTAVQAPVTCGPHLAHAAPAEQPRQFVPVRDENAPLHPSTSRDRYRHQHDGSRPDGVCTASSSLHGPLTEFGTSG